MLNCWATRTSVERVEIAIPIQIAQPASSGVNNSWTSTCVPPSIAEAIAGWANRRRSGEEDPEHHVGDRERRNSTASALPSRNSRGGRGGQHRLERALLAFADDRVGGEGGGQDQRG